MKALTPIILIIVSVAGFFFQVNPKYADVKILRAESAAYDDALELADELKKLRGELAARLASFSSGELQKLERFIPQRLDTVRIILDVTSLAAVHSIELEDIKSSGQGNLDEEGSTHETTSPSFTFTSSYSAGTAFIGDIERSLRLMDVVVASIKPSSTESGLYTFALTLNTYWIDRK